jgi:hypothetical protein
MVMSKNLKASVAVLALTGCASEGVPRSPDAGLPGGSAPGRGRGPGASGDDVGAFLPADAEATGADSLAIGGDAVTTDGATGLGDAVATDGAVTLSDARLPDLLAVAICAVGMLLGCDGGTGDLVPDAGLVDARPATDVLSPDTGKTDVLVPDTGNGYTPNGVTANLGENPCQRKTLHPECFAIGVKCGWDPATDKCYPNESNHINGVCDETKWCSTAEYPPGAILIWNPADPRYTYLGDVVGGSGGYVCLLNIVTWQMSTCPSGCGRCD